MISIVLFLIMQMIVMCSMHAFDAPFAPFLLTHGMVLCFHNFLKFKIVRQVLKFSSKQQDTKICNAGSIKSIFIESAVNLF